MSVFTGYDWALLLAGFVYIVTPGPVFLAIISLVSERGRGFGFRFISGAIFGCMIWLSFTLGSLIEAERLPAVVFLVLAVACAFYLFYMGGRMVMRSVHRDKALVFSYPMREGFMLALLNPKSYPVMTSVLGSVSVHYKSMLDWENFAETFVFVVAGFALGYLFMVFMASMPWVNKVYKRHIRIVSICFGLIFIGFGLSILAGVVPQYF